MGLTIADLDGLEYGAVIDLMTEAANDGVEYEPIAEQSDFDRF